MNETLLQFIVLFPLLGAIIAGLFGRSIGHRNAEIVTSSLLVLAALFSWIVFLQWTMGGGDAGHGDAHGSADHGFAAAESVKVELFRWISTAGLDLNLDDPRRHANGGYACCCDDGFEPRAHLFNWLHA